MFSIVGRGGTRYKVRASDAGAVGATCIIRQFASFSSAFRHGQFPSVQFVTGITTTAIPPRCILPPGITPPPLFSRQLGGSANRKCEKGGLMWYAGDRTRGSGGFQSSHCMPSALLASPLPGKRRNSRFQCSGSRPVMNASAAFLASATNPNTNTPREQRRPCCMMGRPT
jgi:hypothetical protein